MAVRQSSTPNGINNFLFIKNPPSSYLLQFYSATIAQLLSVRNTREDNLHILRMNCSLILLFFFHKSAPSELKRSHNTLIVMETCRNNVVIEVCHFFCFDIAVHHLLYITADLREQLLLMHHAAA